MRTHRWLCSHWHRLTDYGDWCARLCIIHAETKEMAARLAAVDFNVKADEVIVRYDATIGTGAMPQCVAEQFRKVV